MRILLFIGVAAIHLLLIFYLAFSFEVTVQAPQENARVMKLTDFTEYVPAPPRPPPPPPPPQQETVTSPQVESIAETMIETEVVPEQIVVAPGTLITHTDVPIGIPAVETWDDYLPIHRVSDPPRFNERDIMSAVLYPPIAHRSGIEGRVILELFVDKNGVVQQIRILQETPLERGFGEAAVRAFTGRQGIPAMADGEPVSARYRYPVSFRIK